MSELEKIISNLKEKPLVDAVFIAVPQGVGEQTSNSDIDLVVITNEEIDLSDVTQWVDGKQCDVKFFPKSYLNLVFNKETISPNDPEGLIVSFLEKADVRFDKSGFLTTFKNSILAIQDKLLVPEKKKKWFERIINHAYFTNKRYFESNIPEYHEALQIKLLQSLDLLLKGYFEFRNIPWRGERDVLKYLKTNDIKFYELYLACIKTSSIHEKFVIYSDLVNLVFQDGYGLWNENGIYPCSSKSDLNAIGTEKMEVFWKNLIS